MKFKQIYIEDFGILQNQILKDIDHNMVVIGGFNRAGKTTFHNLLKNIGYGFSKGAALPPPKFQYSVTADLLLENKEVYSLKTQGYSEPKLSCFNENNKSQTITKASDIFNIDFYSYSRIFNINLKELNTINKNDRKLQSTLLGAGFKEIISIPSIIDELTKEVDKIGGKQGKGDTKMFKSYTSLISEGANLKKVAANSVKEYMYTKDELISTEEKLALTEKEILKLKSKIIILDTLINFYEKYKRKNELEYILKNSSEWHLIKDFDTTNLEKIKTLKTDYIDTIKDYTSLKHKFILEAKGDLKLRNHLINEQEAITTFYNNISGIREKLKNYEKTILEYENETNSLKIHMDSINSNWNSDFSEILNIESDLLSLNKLNSLIERYTFLNEEIKSIQKSIDNLNFQVSFIENKNNEVNKLSSNKTKFYIILTTIIIALTTFSFIFYKLKMQNNIIFILLYIMLSIIIFFSSIYLKTIIFSEVKVKNKGFKNEINRLDAEIEEKEILREKYNAELFIINKDFINYKNILNVDEKTSPESIREYLKNVQELKRNILNIGLKRKALEGYVIDIRNEVGDLECLLLKLNIIDDSTVNTKNNIIEHSQYILKEIENCKNHLEVAQEFYYVECIKKELENKIIEIINSNSNHEHLGECNLGLRNVEYCETIDNNFHDDLEKNIDLFILKGENYKHLKLINDETLEIANLINANLQSQYVKDSFNSFYNDSCEDAISLFDKTFNTYSSLDEIHEDYNECKVNYDKILKHKEDFKNIIQSLKDKLNTLMVDENLQKGQCKIDEGREGLRPLAEKYAIKSAAAFMIQKVYENFLDNTKDSLFQEASNMMKSITFEEYSKIIPKAELQSSDFSTMLDDGTIENSTDVLSTATKEQLFLSVRLSRIKNFDCKLPVIIDDSFVNFDIKSLKKCIEILEELSKTNQVYILTCHPHMVKYINEGCSDAQFWKLNKGEFKISNASDLEKYLS